MMRSPSARVRKNTVNIYQALNAPNQGTSGGPNYTYSSTPTYANVRCTAQAMDLSELVDAQDQVVQFVDWLFMFSASQSVGPRDKITFTDANGFHTVYVKTERDNAGRGSAFTVRGEEKVQP